MIKGSNSVDKFLAKRYQYLQQKYSAGRGSLTNEDMLKNIPQKAPQTNELPISVALRGSGTQLAEPARPTLMVGIPEIGARAKVAASPVP